MKDNITYNLKSKLVEYINKEATIDELMGLDQLLLKDDVNYGLELILGGEEFDGYISTQAQWLYEKHIELLRSALDNNNVDTAKKILNEMEKL